MNNLLSVKTVRLRQQVVSQGAFCDILHSLNGDSPEILLPFLVRAKLEEKTSLVPASLREADAHLFSFLGRRERGDRNFEKAGMDAMSTDLSPMNMRCRKDGRSIGLISERDKERKEEQGSQEQGKSNFTCHGGKSMANQEHLERFQEGVIVSPEEAGAEVRRLLEDNLPSRSFFEPYRPLRHWFLRPDESGNIHGISHEARVLIWQEILARLLIKEGMSLDQEALRWAAATHDTQRQDDGTDFPHGERAAAWVQRVFQHRLPAPTLERVMYLNTWHVPPDSWAPTMTAELAVFKDADSLDRVRLYDLDPQFLRWDSSKTLLQYLADALFEGSERKQQREGWDVFDAVIETAVELGLVIAQ